MLCISTALALCASLFTFFLASKNSWLAMAEMGNGAKGIGQVELEQSGWQPLGSRQPLVSKEDAVPSLVPAGGSGQEVEVHVERASRACTSSQGPTE